MRVDRLIVEDFTAFGEANFEFSPGLNVFIGANGTGKSHVLKLLYSITRQIGIMGAVASSNSDWNICDLLGEPILRALERTFRPEYRDSPLTSLIRHGVNNATVSVRGDFGAVAIKFGGVQASTDFSDFLPPKGHSVFVPANEMLSVFPGFISAYERRELSFDETLRDICVDLSANPLRSISPPALAQVAANLDVAVGGKTMLKGDRFYVGMADNWLLEAPMLAEGLRKLAQVSHLISNGSICEGCAVFWDEPEANINPKLVTAVAHTILGLAGAGVQVFIATHDYLLTNEISVASEYGTPEGKAANTRFFCLNRPASGEPVTIQSGATVADIEANPILEEFAAHYDRNQKLFARTVSAGE